MFSSTAFLTLVIITSLLSVLCAYLFYHISSQGKELEIAYHFLDHKKCKIAKMETVTDSNADKLIVLQRKYDLLFISKLRVIASSNLGIPKHELYEEITAFLAENNYSGLLDVVLLLTDDFNKQLQAITTLLEQSPEFKPIE